MSVIISSSIRLQIQLLLVVVYDCMVEKMKSGHPEG